MHSPALRVKSITTFILTFVFLLLLSPNLALSQPSSDANAVKSGDWSDPTVWDTGSVPTAGIDVFIENNHTVTYDMPEDGDTAAEAKTITVRHGGVLKFSRNMSTRLDLDGSLMVLMHGTIDVGTKSSPIPAEYTATIGFNVPDDRLFTGNTKPGPNPDMPDFHPDDFGLWVMGMQSKGWFHGAEKNFIWTRLAQPAQKGANQLVLAEAPQGWRVGDQILITPTQENSKEVERRTITGISGDRLTLNQPLTYFHDSALYAYDKSKDKTRAISDPGQLQSGEVLVPVQAEVALLTQNVTITSNLVKEGDPNHRAHTLYMMGGTGNISYAEFRNLGPRAKLGRYPVHFHMLGGGASNFHLKAASIWQDVSDPSNKWVTVHATKDMTVEGCVGYNAQGRGYYLEDSVETGLQFIKNLGVLVHGPEELPKAHLEHIESAGAAVFWMREMNTFKDNVAVAAQPGAAGYWLTENTSGASVASVYENNIAHSNSIGFYGTADNKTLAAVTDFELWRNDTGVRTDERTIVEFKDALLYGNGIDITSGRVKLDNETIVPDHFRVPFIAATVDDNRLWVSNSAYRFYYTFYDGLLKREKFKDFTLKEGLNELTITDTNYLGRKTTHTWTTELDTKAPIITISAAKNPPVTNDRVNPYVLRYTVTEQSGEVTKQIPEYKLFRFKDGENVINATVEAKDLAGNIAQANYTVTYDANYKPPAEDEGNVTFTDGKTTSTSLSRGKHLVPITVDDKPSQDVGIFIVKDTVTFSLDPAKLGNYSPAEFTEVQWMLNGNPISGTIKKSESITYDFVWNTKSVPDGTYSLFLRFISGKELHSFASTYMHLVVDNIAGAREGEQLLPVTRYNESTSNFGGKGGLGGIDYMNYPGFRVKKNNSTYMADYAPPAHSNEDPSSYRKHEIYFPDEILFSPSTNDAGINNIYNSIEGHPFTADHGNRVSTRSENAVHNDREKDFHEDGTRGNVVMSAYTTFVPDPEGDGFYGVTISGSLFRIDLTGAKTTVVGRRQKKKIPLYFVHNTLEEIEAHQIEYVGNFENDLYFNIPNDLYFDPNNPKILYVADTHNHRIAKVDLNTSPPTVTTFAGQAGVAGYKDGVGTAAQFNEPYSLVIDWHTGVMYVADRANNCIRQITPDGTVTTLVGKGKDRLAEPKNHNEALARKDELASGTKTFENANVNFPQVVRLDSKRNIIYGEHTTHSIRKVDLKKKEVSYLAPTFQKFDATSWIWLDVDWRGLLGPVDDFIVTAIQTSRDSGSFNNMFMRFSADGTKIGPVTPNESLGHYPWAYTIDDREARMLGTGGEGNGLPMQYADLVRTRVSSHYGTSIVGARIMGQGTIDGVPPTRQGRPGFLNFFGRKQIHTRLGHVTSFPDLARLNDEDLANYIQAGFAGSVPRPELTGYYLEAMMYYIRVAARERGSEPVPPTPLELKKRVDNVPPVSRNIRATQVGPDRVKVTWWTNEPAIGVVRLGVQPGLYHSSSKTFSDGISYFHEVLVDGLSGVQVNYLRLLVKDIEGNVEEPPEFTFILDSAKGKNHPPVGNNQNVSVEKNAKDNKSDLDIQLTGSDVNGDPLTFSISTPPEHGTISKLNAGTGTLTYTPALDYEGKDSFTFSISDGEFTSTAVVNITVTPIKDDPPRITAFSDGTIDRDTTKNGIQLNTSDTVTLNATAFDPEGKPLDYTWSYSKNGGTAVTIKQGTGIIEKTSFSFKDTEGGSTYRFTLTVTDGTTSPVSRSTDLIELLADKYPLGLVAHFPFDETSGTVAHDVSRYMNHAGITGDTFSWIPGRINGAIELKGAKITIPERGQLKYTHKDVLTIAMHVVLDATNNQGYLYRKDSQGKRRFNLIYKREGAVRTEISSTWHADLDVFMNPSIPPPTSQDDWSHLAFTYDGTKDKRVVKFFLDGKETDQNVLKDALSGSFDSNIDPEIQFSGRLDDFCFYNRELTQEELNYLASGNACNNPPEITTFRMQAADRSSKSFGTQVHIGDKVILTSAQTDSDSPDKNLSYEVFYKLNGKKHSLKKGKGATSKTGFTIPAKSIGNVYEFFIEVTDGIDKVLQGPLSLKVIKDILAPQAPTQLQIKQKK